MIGFFLALILQLNQVLIKYGCSEPRVFALQNEVVLSCETGEWREQEVIPRASALISSLVFSYPYGEKYSLVLRRFKIPELEITVDRESIIKFLQGKMEPQDYLGNWRVYRLREKAFRFYGLPMKIVSTVVNPQQEGGGKVQMENFRCKNNKIYIEFSYAFVDTGILMLIIKREEGRIVEYFQLKGSGNKKWRKELPSLEAEVKAELYLWRGNWIKIWEEKQRCQKEEK